MGRTIIHTQEAIFDHPVEHVWSLLSSFGAIKAWMPSIKWCKIEGEGIGAVRTVMSMAGEAVETLEVLDPKSHRVAYRINDIPAIPAKGCYGTWVLQSVGDEKTKVTWNAEAEDVSSEAVTQLSPFYAGFMKESLDGFQKALA